ncbi:glycogen debranching protein, partial [Glaesserella parasuis]
LPITYHIDEPHLQKIGLCNYWGYNVLGHFAVDPKLAYNKADPLTEFKQLVKTLHKAGIEVIMDVVFNHTAEAGKDGPMLSQRGIDNEAYYWLTDNSEYLNWTGCGNTLNVSSDVAVLRWVIDCLCYWVKECHVDGFRFDLGAVLGRAPTFSEKSAFFTAVYSNSKLAHIKLIAEPWDIGWSGYQLGAFPKPFAEWNDRFRDDMRRFFLEKNGNLAGFVRRFAGSDDIFAHNRQPFHSINFITAHDGFTLQDLVSYNEKHNWANGEQNRDGHGHNISFNFGVEGETDNPIILKQRKQAKKALLTTLLLSGGTPMVLAGDELGHSQQGNNNSYCQDNEISWIDWDSADQELIDYTAKLIAIRKQIPLLSQDTKWWTGEDVQWL